MPEINVIFELGDATHAEVMLDEVDARHLLAFLQRDGFVSNDSTVGQVANALKYVLEPESTRCSECGGPLEGWAGEQHSQQCSLVHAGPIPAVNDECPDNDTGDEHDERSYIYRGIE